jgi:hypothetical protein
LAPANKKAGRWESPTFALAKPADYTILNEKNKFLAGARQAQIHGFF